MLKSKQLNIVQRGFTIVELLIVIVVIGILAALVLNTFANVQAQARDTERQTDMKSVSSQLEVYYADEGNYPLLATINAGIEGMDEGALEAPGEDTSSLSYGATSGTDSYGYTCVDATDTVIATAPTDEEDCVGFELSYTKERLKDGETNPIVITSLN